jgi:hypothetical protein
MTPKASVSTDERMAKMTFATVYPHYVTKVEKKNRTQTELNQAIEWLTGFDEMKLQELVQSQVNFEDFFEQAHLNPYSHLVKGVICGVRIEEIENPLTQKIRILDKLVDDLANGRKYLREILG